MNKWQELPLEQCLSALIDYRGRSPTKSMEGIPVISAKVVKNGRIVHPVEQTIDPGYYAEWMRRGLPSVGDVVLTTEGPLGQVAQLDPQTVRYALGQRIVVLRGREGVLDNTFLKFLLQSDLAQHRLHSFATGTTVAGVSQKSLRQLPLPLPPISEQKRIAELLGSLDDKIELNRRTNETLEAMAQAIFQDWFVDFGPTRRKLDGATDPVTIMGGLVTDPARAQELADLFPATLGDDGLPEGWCFDTVRSLCTSIENGGTPRRNVPEYWAPGTIPWLTSGEVREAIVINAETMISEEGLANSSAKVWPSDTTVIAMYGATAGQVSILAKPVATNQACCGLRPKPDYVLYVYHLMRGHSSGLANLATGAAQQNLSQKTISEYKVLRPSDAAVGAFEHWVRPLLNRRIGALNECITLASTRDLLLPKLMTEEIRLGAFMAEAAQ